MPHELAPSPLRGTETVLVVEDEDSVRAVACSALRRYGYKVIEARNGGEALLVCEKYPSTIHLLLADIVMPQMSGPELAKRLAELRQNMKVLFMTGYTGEAVGALVASGAQPFLQKPLTVCALTQKVREVLDAATLPASSAA